MQRNACLASAGRAVLEMMQFDWEPLSHGELEQRLDQAVEEILEADLIARVQRQCGPIILQVSRPEYVTTHVVQAQIREQVAFELSDSAAPSYKAELSVDSETRQQSSEAAEESAAVQYIMDLLQNSNSSYNRSRLAGRARLSLAHTVLLSLTLLSKRLSYRSVSSSFRLEKGNIHRIFFSFCERVNALEDQLIRWPTAQEVAENALPFSSWLGRDEALEARGLPRVMAALGHTRVPIRLPVGKQGADGGEPEVRRLKKEAHPDSWLHLELACDARGRLVHCHVSRGSERHRGRALAERLRQHPAMVPAGACVVACVGYPLTAQILTPFAPGRGSRENLYNRSVETHLGQLDQAVACLKARFQRLRYLDMGNYERAKAVVRTACVLHNMFLDMGDEVKGQVEKEAREREEEGEKEVQGLRRREVVADLLYSALEAGE